MRSAPTLSVGVHGDRGVTVITRDNTIIVTLDSSLRLRRDALRLQDGVFGCLEGYESGALARVILQATIHRIVALVYAVVLDRWVKEGTFVLLKPRHVKASVV